MKFVFVWFVLFMPLFLLAEEESGEVLKSSGGKETIRKADSWLGKDKAKHVVASFLLTGAGTWWSRHQCHPSHRESLQFGFSFAFSVGMAKEFWDQRAPGGYFSWKDVVADLLGIGMGILLLGGW